MTVKLYNSPLYYQHDGDWCNYNGIPIEVAVVASPLVEEGSGHSIDHPDITRKVCCPTKISAEIPITKEAKDSISVALVGTSLKKGDTIIQQKSIVNPSGYALEVWGHHCEGKVISEPSYFHNLDTNILHVTVTCMIISSSPEKYRGYGKYRSNGGFLLDLEVREGNNIIFNPKSPLKEGNTFLQSERVVGGEEYKTLMYVLNILAHDMPDGKIYWNGVAYEDEEQVIKLVEEKAKRVTVTRGNLESSVYQMFKSIYGDDDTFTFEDDTRTVTHHNVWCWTGTSVEMVEVPLTSVFMGKTKLFAEHIHYIGTEYPHLYSILLDELMRNQKLVERALDMVEEVENSSYVIMGDETEIIYGEKINLDIYEGYLMKLSLPDYTMDTLKRLTKMLRKAKFKGLTLEGTDRKGDNYQYPIDLQVFLSLTGSISHKAVRNLFLLFQCLETPYKERTGKTTSAVYRYMRLISGVIEGIVVDSNALLARGAKTGPIAYTCRAASTIDASVALDELHISQSMATEWGLEEGDFIIPGRVPVPGVGVLKLVINNRVPYATVVLSAATKHAIEEGDVDGDSIIFLAFSKDGILRKPSNNLADVVVKFD